MINSDDSLLKAVKNISGKFSSIDSTTKSIFELDKKEIIYKKRRKQKEERDKARLAQIKSRAESDREGKSPIASMLKGKEESFGMDLKTGLLIALGLAGAGATWLLTSDDPNAKKLRDDLNNWLGEKVNWLREEIKKHLENAIKDIIRTINNQAEEWSKQAGATDVQEEETASAPGTIAEKIERLRSQKQNLNWLERLQRVDAEIDEQIYYLEAGETRRYDKPMGGSAGTQGEGIVTGDIVDVLKETPADRAKDRQTLLELEKMTRDRRKINDNLAAALSAGEEERAGRIRTRLMEMDQEIGTLLDENDQLRKLLLNQRDIRHEKVIHRQSGGPIMVPGYGDGDKVSMQLPPGSFVLNREASAFFPLLFQSGGIIPGKPSSSVPADAIRRQKGGPVYGEAHIMDYARSRGIKGKELASFMGQMSHESGNFRYATEIDSGEKYEGRKVLGNNEPGDGPRFKGRGYIQLTGRWNYGHFGDKIGVDLVNNPALAARPDVAAKIAVQYWMDRVNRDAARRGDVVETTRGINDGLNGLKDRKTKTARYMDDPRIHLVGPAVVGEGKVGQKIVGTGNPVVDVFNTMTGKPAVGSVIRKQSGGKIEPYLPFIKSLRPDTEPKQSLSRQIGGVVSGTQARFEENQQHFIERISESHSPQTVVVMRRPHASPPSGGGGKTPAIATGSEINIVEMKSKLHRISTGAKYS